jgi:hypothetical protein
MISSLSGMTRRIAAAILGFAALCPMTVLAQQVTVERDSELRAEPRLEAPVTAKLVQGTTGEVVAKSGAWLQLKTPAASGWLFSFNVRFTSARAAGDSGAGSALGRLIGPRREVAVTATIGVRGLEEEDLRQAKFDAAQMKRLDQYAATPEDSADRARAAGLAPVKVDYFDAKPQ